MKTWIVRISIGLAVLVALIAAGLAAFLLTFDPNTYKARLEAFVQERYHRSLSIDGDMDVSLFPRIGLELQGVALSEPNSSEPFASVESARMAVAIWPLLSHNLVVDHLAINGFKASVVRDGQGRFNFRDLATGGAGDAGTPDVTNGGATGGNAAPDNAAGAGGAGQPARRGAMRIDIAGLELKDGELQWRDEAAGTAMTVTGVNAKASHITFGKPFDVSLSAHAKGDHPQVDADVSGQMRLQLDASGNRYAAHGMDVKMTGSLAGARVGSLMLRGDAAYEVATGKLDAGALEIAFEGDVPGDTYPMTKMEAGVAATRLVVDPGRQLLQAEKLTVRAKGRLGHDLLEFAADAPKLDISPQAATGDGVTARLRLSGTDGLDASIGLTGLGGNSARLAIQQMKLDAAVTRAGRVIKASMASPLTIDVHDRAFALAALGGNVAINDGALPGGGVAIPVTGSVAADLLKDKAAVQLAGTLQNGKFSFVADATRLKDGPVANVALATDSLDLDALLPSHAAANQAPASAAPVPAGTTAPTPAAKSPEAQGSAPAATSDAIDLSALIGPAIKGTVKIGHLVARGVKADNVAATLALDKGKLAVTGLGAALYQGKLTGQFSVDAANGNAAAAKLALDGVALGPLLTDLTRQAPLTGTASLSLDLNSSGLGIDALKRNLAGPLQLRVRNGAVKGIDIAQLLRDLKTVLGRPPAQDETVVPADQSRQTAFSQLDADLAFAAGVGTVKHLQMVAPPLQATQGSPALIDVGAGRLDLATRIKIADSPKTDPDLAALRGITVPLHITGPFDSLAYRVDWRAFAAETLTHTVRNRLRDALSGKKGNGSDQKVDQELRNLGNVLKGLRGKD